MKIVVVGDVLLDVDLSGAATRLCPDAPVPVVDVAVVSRRAGGAGLVAAMLAADGADVELVTVLSDDPPSHQLRSALAGIALVTGPSGAPTPVKSRVRANQQTVVRFDEGCTPAPAPEATADMLAAIDRADVVLVADYGRGLTANPALRAALTKAASRIPVVWDPHPAGTDPVPGVRVVTPNQGEAAGAANVPAGAGGTVAAAAQAAAALLGLWQPRSIAVTLGAAGVLLLDAADGLPPARAARRAGADAGPVGRLIPAVPVPLADPCGAGDRFAATLAAHLGAGDDLADAARAAVRDAAAFLAAGGVAALDGAGTSAREEPLLLGGDRVDALRLVRRVRQAGGRIVATGGCFDLLHAGHVRTLAAARRLGDALVVCVNSDESVARLKGRGRPIIAEADRVELLESLECVDAVVVFSEDTPEAVLSALQPDIWVKGGDYSPGELPEAALLQGWGGQTITVPYHPARSTTALAGALARVG